MPKKRPSYKAILSEVARSSARSSLFWWLVEHHDKLLDQSVGKRLNWEALCELFDKHSLTDINGRRPTARTARETWLQARKVVAETRARKAIADASRKPGDVYPSRLPVTWRPQLADPPPSVAPGRPSASSVAVAPTPGVVLDATVQAKIDRALAGLAERDRKKNGHWG